MKGDPIYTATEAAFRLGITPGAMRQWLRRHPEFTPRYRAGEHRTRVRILTWLEVESIRQLRAIEGSR